MSNRGKTLKVTAVLVLSALALTGFSTGRGHGGGSRHSGGGGGGGCSSSSQDHDSSSSSSSGSSGSSASTTSGSGYDDDDDAYGSSGAGSSTGGGSYNRPPTHDSTTSGSSSSSGGSQLENAKVKLVTCATEKDPYATVKVTNGNAKKGRFWVSVTFVDADGITVIEESEEVKVPGKGKTTARIEIGGEGLAASVARCDVDPQAVPVTG
ncbi:hypothetical protein [Streptomyces sp. NPDC051214]|uniref:hypothetical protein n=1 Tax=Streptomyces sp. NPDC051214 TaxID=3155282 RepID=UPI0034267BB0